MIEQYIASTDYIKDDFYVNVRNALSTRTLNMDIRMIQSDLFDVCVHYTSQSIADLDVKSQYACVVGGGKCNQYIPLAWQDVYFESISEYIEEAGSVYWEDSGDLERFSIANDLASVCLHTIEQLIVCIGRQYLLTESGNHYYRAFNNSQTEAEITRFDVNPIPYRNAVFCVVEVDYKYAS